MKTSIVRAVGRAISILMVVVVASCDDDGGPVDPDGSECRAYPTAFTETSVDNVSTVRVTYSGTHDTTTHQTTYNVQYSDSAGPDFSYVLVTTYRSTEEFVDEVKVNPPRTLSTRSTATGSNGFTIVNSFDAQRRLTETSTTALGETVTTRYTNWENGGRPTEGARSISGPLTINYNDATRTRTSVFVGAGTEVATFDINGNPSTATRNFGPGQVTTTTTIASTANICK